ncbi:bifunctional 2-polyprenyl-6-hydroxyphenol methylase/3-demethylubiquinol 3-O-methyltransferase UbiG [Rhizobium sp. SSA_523]|uniref:class I SAM-dependent methyltransferase n=1 Tax=Rhizobium sp. SSA_523 TaxID=2952477 RepID=UPI00209094F3|nr:class I SAM-dependent methyltransferase [Rhizobium sp. SSA_523]MCO5732485.1 class I SAM-dependent methyltransferase [Rhizobium sp. SSA_523]WKC22374.1 class I SAM-dependent methyltransferase [Rhizobium sp. SSA_523]
MSGFESGWLSLREPADARARNDGLLAELGRYLHDGETPARLMDIGCGTGSTFRSLAGRLPDNARWTLVDYDSMLLAEAERRIGHENVDYLQLDLSSLDALPLQDCTVLTASAFFDLCSAAFCEGLASKLSAAGTGLYAALNYDGRIAWTNRHVLDLQIVRIFNRHQTTDKGLGQALGPMATPHLKTVLENEGFRVSTADSPWRLGPAETALHRAFVEGMVAPVLEMAELDHASVMSWRDARLADIDEGGSCLVGHLDLLALPAK